MLTRVDGVQQRAEDAEDEHGARDVERDHQDAEAHDRGEPGLADDRRDRAERAERGEPEDHAEDAEHQRLQVLDRVHDRLALGAHLLQREADQQGDEQHLQHALAGERREERRRDDAEDELLRRLGLGRRGVVRRARHVQALTRVDEVADDQADRQREGRHDHEVQQRQSADLADGRGLRDRADADHDRAEDDRRDHHLDEGDEALADRLERDADLRPDQADRRAEHDRDDHRDVQPGVLVPCLSCRAASCSRGA